MKRDIMTISFSVFQTLFELNLHATNKTTLQFWNFYGFCKYGYVATWVFDFSAVESVLIFMFSFISLLRL